MPLEKLACGTSTTANLLETVNSLIDLQKVSVMEFKTDTNTWDDALDEAIALADSSRKQLYLGNSNISVSRDIVLPNSMDVLQESRGALIGNGSTSVIIDNSATSNGKKKVFGTIANMDRALVIRGSINEVEFHTLSGSRQGLVIESLSDAKSDRSLDNIVRGVQIGVCDDGIVFQQHADESVQQGNEIRVNFLSGVKDAVVFDDDGQHTKTGDWDSNLVDLQAIDNQRSDASFLINKSSFPVNNQNIYSHSWNGGLLSPDSRLIKGGFRGCDLKFITAVPVSPDDIVSESDATLIATSNLQVKRAGSKTSVTGGEMVTASATQDLASFNGGQYLQSNEFLVDCTLANNLSAGAVERCFIFHTMSYTLDKNPFTIKAYNTVTLQSVDLMCAVSTSTFGDRGMVSVWMMNKTTAALPAGTNIRAIISVSN